MSKITNRPLAAAILSLSISTFVTGAAVSPALAQIARGFPGSSPLAIQMIISLPAISIIPASLASGRLARWLGKRNVTLMGMVVYVLGGAGAALAPSMWILLFFRFILGIGAGLLLPLAISLIADFYVGPDRTRLTGYSGGVAGLGGTVITLLAGWLGEWGWRQVFLVYLVMLIPMVLVFFYLKEPPIREDDGYPPESLVRLFLNPQVLKASALMFFITVMVFALPIYMAVHLETIGRGGPTVASWILVMPNLSGIVSGLIFLDFKKLFRWHVYPAGFVLLGSGFFMLAFSTQLLTLVLGSFIFGLGLGVLNPLNYLRVVNAVSLDGAPWSLALANSFMFLAQFTAPLYYGILSGIGFVSGVSQIFLFNGVISFMLALVMGVRGQILKNEIGD